MLKELRLTNFKSFAEEQQTISFAPVTVFVGANASGKSNVFDAMRFLQGFASKLSISEILSGKMDGGREVFQPIRGGAAEIAWNSSDSFEIECHLDVIIDADGFSASKAQRVSTNPGQGAHQARLVHRVKVDVEPHLIIQDEQLSSIDSSGTECELLHASLLDESTPTVKLLDGIGLSLLDSDFFSTTLSYLKYADADADFEEILLSKLYSRTLSGLLFLDIRPADMRDYADARLRDLGSTGKNLSAVIYNICQDSHDKEMLVSWISAVCVPEIADITFDETGLGDVLVQLEEANGTKRTISARSLSDGTLRFMGLLAALFSAPKGSIFLFEEIENGLHPTRLHLLVELFEQFAEERGIQIIATTHSPQVLLALSDEALRNTVLFARDEEHPGTIVRRLRDLPHFDEVTQRANIDELFTTGWLEFAV